MIVVQLIQRTISLTLRFSALPGRIILILGIKNISKTYLKLNDPAPR